MLWSLDRRSRSLAVFENTSHYAINVLCADQVPLASRFAAPIENRFEGVAWNSSKSGMPLFDGCVAWFECESAFKYDGGDHVIFVGRVTDFGHGDRTPLLYAGGRYSVPAVHPEAKR